MVDSPGLPVVTVRELSRKPSVVLNRVARGERLIVCRHGRPVATLQPLGVVVDPIVAATHDVGGEPVTDLDSEAMNLSEIQRGLLTWGVDRDRLAPMRLVGDYAIGAVMRAVDGLGVRGLAQKTHRGWVLTGRGMILHEALTRGRAGEDPGPWRIRGNSVEP